LLHLGDCLEVLRTLPENSVDALVSDPPYGWRFMGKAWDAFDIEKMASEATGSDPRVCADGVVRKPRQNNLAIAAGKYDTSQTGNQAFQVFTEQWAKEAFRVLKPGGHALIFCGPRTYHRMASGVEDAGFEIRDQLQWIFGSGFPKNLDVRKAGIKSQLFCGCEEIPKYNLRPMSETDLSQKIDPEVECEKVLQPCVPEQGLCSERLQGNSEIREEQSLLAGRVLYRNQQGVSTDANAGSPSSEEKRLRSGTCLSDGEVDRKTVKEERSGSSHQSPGIRQSSGEPETVFESQGALGGEPYERCSQCSKTILPQGLGTSLKPANEPIVLARKPISERTIALNVQRWGTGAINVDASRIGTEQTVTRAKKGMYGSGSTEKMREQGFRPYHIDNREQEEKVNPPGRFPSNVLLDDRAAELLDEQTGELASRGQYLNRTERYDVDGSTYKFGGNLDNTYANQKGGASRFFMRFQYCAKSSQSERNAGLEGMPEKSKILIGAEGHKINPTTGRPVVDIPRANIHPTVKPIKLMEYLCRLITPPGGKILDPFMGSGTTGIAAKRLGFEFIGIELNPEYFEIATRRIENAKPDEVAPDPQLTIAEATHA
jgi:DNA modification methylase